MSDLDQGTTLSVDVWLHYYWYPYVEGPPTDIQQAAIEGALDAVRPLFSGGMGAGKTTVAAAMARFFMDDASVTVAVRKWPKP